MHSDLIIHFSQATQDEIARSSARRATFRSRFQTMARRMNRRSGRPVSARGGTMSPWRHGSPAHGS
jgi:hypothetical protein